MNVADRVSFRAGVMQRVDGLRLRQGGLFHQFVPRLLAVVWRRLRGKETSASFIHSVGDDGAGREILEEGGALFDTVQHHCEEGVLHHRGSCVEELLPLAHCVHTLALFIQAEPALPDGLQRIPHSCLARGHPAVGEDEDEDGDDALACRRLLP